MRPTRVAVIGCGYFARYHLAAWRSLAVDGGVELVGVCDIDRAKADAAAKAYGVAYAFTDAATMLNEAKLDLVDIATRMDTHRFLAGLCADRGIAAIVQKPLAPDWESAVDIVGRAARADTFLAVHENFRFQRSMQRVAQILGSGAIGAPTWARIAFRTGVDVYKNQPYFLTEDRLVILDLGIHLLDLARVFLGEVERVFCETQRRNRLVKAEDTATITLRHRSGAVSVVECTYESRRLPTALSEIVLEIEGSGGALSLDRSLNLALTSKGEVSTENLIEADFDIVDPAAAIAVSSVLETCRHVLGAYRSGTPAAVSGADNLRTYALVEAAYRSAVNGRSETPAQWTTP